tara:strand:- start:3816 stop:5942 length:2127 start_codon:yes stop_codon:yes gene_type:complete
MLHKKIIDEKFSFLDFEVDPQANLLIKNAREKRLESKVMALLILLAGKSGEVVTRAEILEALWPNVIVGDEVISQVIYSLRNVLGDDAKKPRYIETIPKKGYRFMVKVNITALEESPLATAHSEAVSINMSKTKRHKKLASIGLVIIAAVIFAIIAKNLFLPKYINAFNVENILPVTKQSGVEGDFAFHQAHNNMIYVRSSKESTDLFLRKLDINQSQQLTNDLWIEYSPLWLDAKTFIYIRKKSGLYQIIRQPLFEPQNIEILYESTNSISNLALNLVKPDELTFSEYDNYQHNRLNELKAINLVSGETHYLHDTLLNLPSDMHHLVYSLDGNSLYFFDYSDRLQNIVMLDLKNNQYTTIANQFRLVTHIALVDEEHLLISGQLASTKGIWLLHINDGSIQNILPSASGQSIVQAFIKDQQLYYATHKASMNLVVADIKNQHFDLLPTLNSDAHEYSAIYSKDNNSLYFVSNRTGYYELWTYNLDSKDAKQITQLEAAFINKPILSHGEEYIAVVYEKEHLTLAVISLLTGESINEIKIPNKKFPLAWSQDDNSIFISEHKGQVNIYQYDRQTLQATLIQKRAGLFAQQDHDGENLMLIDYKMNGLINKNTINQQKVLLNNSISNLLSLIPGELKVVGDSILSVKQEGPLRKLLQYTIKNDTDNKGRWLMDLPNWSMVTDYNNEGNKAIFAVREPPQGDIMKVIFSQ